LILAEGKSGDAHYGKTMRGVVDYSPNPTVAILDSERPGETHKGIPVVGSVADALPYEPTTALVGVATQGGRFPPAWRELLRRSIEAGLDVESGLHEFLSDDAEIATAAAAKGVSVRDLRKVPHDLDVPTGANLDTKAHVVLTVGSDCALGKMTVCLELDRETRRRGHASVFVPTGQTGIAIAGWGIAVDQVVSDFVAGAAERLVVDGHARGGDGAILWIEGQGSLNHPYYSGVTLGLLHGSAPHAMVFVHEPGRELIEGDPRYPIGGLAELIDDQIRMARHVRPAPVVAVALKTNRMDEESARAAIAQTERDTGLVADDPVRFGAGRILEAVLSSR